MAQNPVENEQFESFPQLHETPEEIAFELRAPEGRALDRRAPAHRHLGLRLRGTGVRLLLSPLGEQPGSMAPKGHHGANRRPARPSSPSRWRRRCWCSYGERRFRTNQTLDWQVAGWTAVLGGLLAVGLQIWQLTELPFFPGSSGYASCFIALGRNEHRPGPGRHLLDRDDPGPGDPAAACHGSGRRRPDLDSARCRACSGRT